MFKHTVKKSELDGWYTADELKTQKLYRYWSLAFLIALGVFGCFLLGEILAFALYPGGKLQVRLAAAPLISFLLVYAAIIAGILYLVFTLTKKGTRDVRLALLAVGVVLFLGSVWSLPIAKSILPFDGRGIHFYALLPLSSLQTFLVTVGYLLVSASFILCIGSLLQIKMLKYTMAEADENAHKRIHLAEMRRREEAEAQARAEEEERAAFEEFQRYRAQGKLPPREEEELVVEAEPDYFVGCDTLEKAKARHRALCKAYHPDTGNGDVATIQVINTQYEELLKRFEV